MGLLLSPAAGEGAAALLLVHMPNMSRSRQVRGDIVMIYDDPRVFIWRSAEYRREIENMEWHYLPMFLLLSRSIGAGVHLLFDFDLGGNL